MTDTEASPSRDWPQDVEAAVSVLVSSLSDDDKAKVRLTAEANLITFHHGWGTGIRNGFGLLAGNRPLIESCIELGGPACGDPDAASGVIIKAVWNRLNHLPLHHHQRVVFDSYRCECCGGEAHVRGWEEDERTPPANPQCHECTRKTSPEYIQRQEQIRSKNEAANSAFEKARQLGVLVNRHYLMAIEKRSWLARFVTSSHDDLLLKVARDLYTKNPEFHRLWDEVKGDAPRASHVAWLRLWKRL
jgi:hypothetical protein